jgi:hypothetical protein
VAVDGVVRPRPFLDLSGRVQTASEHQGLLGLAFHPNYAANGRFFVTYVALNGDNVLARYRVAADDPNRADPDSAVILLDLPDRMSDHNLGMLAFGPDGYLYVGAGDEGGFGNPFGNAEDPGSLFGKILRLDVDRTGPAGEPYAVPPDNPFVDTPGARGDVWARGLRNPWRFAFDRLTGDLWIADVGQDSYEEVNRQPAASPGGQHYGWSVMEGTHCFPGGSSGCDPAGLILPVAEYSHDEGCSVTGGYVYRGGASPALGGIYVLGDFCSGRIWALEAASDGGWLRTELLDTDRFIASFGEDEAGEVYLVDLVHGTVERLVATAGNPVPTISGIYPAFVIPGGQGFTLRVYGAGFRRDSLVHWGGMPRPTTYASSTQLTAEIPAGDVAALGDAIVTVVNPAPGGGVSNAQPFHITLTDISVDAFARVWERTDKPVADLRADRTWMWGPEPATAPIDEEYAESPNGIRTVRYYDKSRMEVTNPGADQDAVWYVTNGLLARELMLGDLQLGDYRFEHRAPAAINIAGDPDPSPGSGQAAAPTYATFARLMPARPFAEGAPLTATVDGAGQVGDDPALAGYGVTAAFHVQVPGIDHRVASVFWDFMNMSGLVYADGAYVEGLLFENPFYATGLPLTEAYWTRVKVGGVERLVLVQAFERRVLTWTPDNPAGWQVEFGNIGRHYYVWRYGEPPINNSDNPANR